MDYEVAFICGESAYRMEPEILWTGKNKMEPEYLKDFEAVKELRKKLKR